VSTNQVNSPDNERAILGTGREFSAVGREPTKPHFIRVIGQHLARLTWKVLSEKKRIHKHKIRKWESRSNFNRYIGQSSKIASFLDIGFHQYSAAFWKRCKIWCKLALFTNRKSQMSFQLLPNSAISNYLEWLNGYYIGLFHWFC